MNTNNKFTTKSALATSLLALGMNVFSPNVALAQDSPKLEDKCSVTHFNPIVNYKVDGKIKTITEEELNQNSAAKNYFVNRMIKMNDDYFTIKNNSSFRSDWLRYKSFMQENMDKVRIDFVEGGLNYVLLGFSGVERENPKDNSFEEILINGSTKLVPLYPKSKEIPSTEDYIHPATITTPKDKIVCDEEKGLDLRVDVGYALLIDDKDESVGYDGLQHGLRLGLDVLIPHRNNKWSLGASISVLGNYGNRTTEDMSSVATAGNLAGRLRTEAHKKIDYNKISVNPEVNATYSWHVNDSAFVGIGVGIGYLWSNTHGSIDEKSVAFLDGVRQEGSNANNHLEFNNSGHYGSFTFGLPVEFLLKNDTLKSVGFTPYGGLTFNDKDVDGKIGVSFTMRF